jgi:hypothetical protein
MTLALGLRPRQKHGKMQAKNVTQESHLHSWECEGMISHTLKWIPTLGVGSLIKSRIFKEVFFGVKIHWIIKFLIPLKSFWNINVSKWFAWPIWIFKTLVMVIKKRPGIKVSIWVSPTKSWELPWTMCV